MGRQIFVDVNRLMHDTIDGETIIIDSVEGRLHVLGGAAPVLWHAATLGADTHRLVDEVADRYGPDASVQALSFVNTLLSQGLVTLVDGPAGDTTSLEWPQVFTQPRIEQFDDIADILTMDPIHEVDVSRGWPRRAIEP